MIKKLTTAILLFISVVTFSQVGIGTENPHASSDLELASPDKALYLNRVADPVNDIADPQPGMILYDTTMKCVRAYQGDSPAWSACIGLGLSTGEGSIESFDCASAVFDPATATQGQDYTGSTLTIPYTGGNGGAYPEDEFTVDGLTFHLPEGSYQDGDGVLVYDIIGTPTTAGTITIGIYQNGAECPSLELPVNSPVGSVSSIDCSAALSPTAIAGETSYSGTFTVAYTGGNGGSYLAQSLSSSAPGFTATLTAGNFATGAGSVTYNVTAATVPAAGSYTFSITLGGQTCNKTITVNQNGTGVLPTSVTLAQNRRHWVASVYDQDYLPYVVPTEPASTAVLNADGGNEPVVDYQGTITMTGITVQIPVASFTGSGNKTIGAWTNTITVPANLTQEGSNPVQLQLSWSQQTINPSTTKFITATIKAVGSTFNAKKLDINTGIGNDYLGVLLGAFQYPYNNAGTLTSYEVRDIPGIPDKMFGQYDNGGPSTGYRHNFLYLPVQGEDGNIWLNNNLGADYSNINHPSFNPAQQATFSTDYNAYGSLFQWGRKGDGHELITWTDSTIGTAVNTTINGPLPEPLTTPRFIQVLGGVNVDWRTPAYNVSLWDGENAVNNPCPYGFEVPSPDDFTALVSAIMPASGTLSTSSSVLRFTNTGVRINSNVYGNTPSNYGAYYTNAASDLTIMYLMNSNGSYGSAERTRGQALRCVKNH